MADTSRRARDPRLDVFRGIALMMIFVNHVPGNPLEALTSRNFGFSDAAEGFVFIAGLSAALAYGSYWRPSGGDPWQGTLRIGKRVWTLYLVHLLITMVAFGIAAAATLWFDAPGMLQRNGIPMLFRQPLHALVGIPLLGYQLGYADILPLYIVLLAVTPLLLWLAWRWPVWLLGGSVLLWALAAEFHLNLPDVFGTGTWFFSPAAWQLLFVLGLLSGVAMRDGRRLVPVRPWLVWLSCGILGLSLLWMVVPGAGTMMNTALWQAQEAGVPAWITSFNKNYLYLPRLLHFVALAYVLSSLPVVMRICADRRMRPVAMLGRQGLPVFALGSALAYVLQTVKTETGVNLALDLAMVLAGLGLLFAFAWVRTRIAGRTADRAMTAPAPPAEQTTSTASPHRADLRPE